MEVIQGIHDISFEEYKKIDALNQSSLKHLLRCPAYFAHMINNVQPDTDAMKFGRMIHSFLLENKNFEKEYFITEKIRRAGSKWDAILFEANNREVVFDSDFAAAKSIKNSLGNNEYFKKTFDESLTEQTLIWHDDASKLYCKARLDGIKYSKDHKTCVIYDLKTTQDCTPWAFKKSFFQYNYHIQTAFYADGIAKVTGITPEYVIIFAIEKDAPFLTANYVIPFDSDIIKAGREEYKHLLSIYKHCLDTGNFLIGFDESLEIIDKMPSWYNKNNEENTYE